MKQSLTWVKGQAQRSYGDISQASHHLEYARDTTNRQHDGNACVLFNIIPDMNAAEIRLLKSLRESAERDVHFFSNKGKSERERWVVREFLNAAEVTHDEMEIISQPNDSEIDVCFRGANFQIKEIIEPNSLRTREAKEHLKFVKSIGSFKDLIWPISAKDIPPLTRIYDLIKESSQCLSKSGNYPAQTRSQLDLLFYVTRPYASLISAREISEEDFHLLGWRSVSCLVANSTTNVMFASENAPAFIIDLKGLQRKSIGNLNDF